MSSWNACPGGPIETSQAVGAAGGAGASPDSAQAGQSRLCALLRPCTNPGASSQCSYHRSPPYLAPGSMRPAMHSVRQVSRTLHIVLIRGHHGRVASSPSCTETDAISCPECGSLILQLRGRRTAVQAHAWVALGKLCLTDEATAKKCLPLFVQELGRDSHPAVSYIYPTHACQLSFLL
jgi:hypothetical protein